MREIKFRYKIKNRDKLMYDTNEDFGYLQQQRTIIADSMSGLLIVEDEMQFTGLKDKNGKDIYEGDIIHINGELRDSFNAIVKFKNGRFITKCLCGCNKDYTYFSDTAKDKYDNIKVIGNKFQNPELLKKQ